MIEIVPCEARHLDAILPNIREHERRECAMVGADLEWLMRLMWGGSSDPKAAIVGGDVAAVWGDWATLASTEGYMWLFTSAAVERIPFGYFREAKRDLQSRLRRRAVLRCSIHEGEKRERRVFGMLGFKEMGVDEGGFIEMQYRRAA